MFNFRKKKDVLIWITAIGGGCFMALYVYADLVLPLYKLHVLSGGAKLATATVIRNTRLHASEYGTQYRWEIEYDGYRSTLATRRPMKLGETLSVVYAVEKPTFFVVGTKAPQVDSVWTILVFSPTFWVGSLIVVALVGVSASEWLERRREVEFKQAKKKRAS